MDYIVGVNTASILSPLQDINLQWTGVSPYMLPMLSQIYDF